MKIVVFLALVCLAAGAALPEGFSSPQEVATVLANEPASASRFAQQAPSNGDTITFQDTGSESGQKSEPEGDEDTAEFDAQISQVEGDIKKLKEKLKTAQEAAREMNELNAQVKQLFEQKDHLEKEKQKAILNKKLEAQRKDLNEITRMSRSIQSKWRELQRTQKVIKMKLRGTQASLGQLEAEPEADDDDLSESADQIPKEMEAMHASQRNNFESSQQKNTKKVKSHLDTSISQHKKMQEQES